MKNGLFAHAVVDSFEIAVANGRFPTRGRQKLSLGQKFII